MYRQKARNLARDLTAAIPQALKQLREQAGYRSLRPAARAIEERTGHSLSPATLSEWERGTKPVSDSLVYFLVGLGYDFRDFQGALEDIVEKTKADPATELVKRLQEDPGLRDRLRDLLRKTSADPEKPGEGAEEILEILDTMEDFEDVPKA